MSPRAWALVALALGALLLGASRPLSTRAASGSTTNADQAASASNGAAFRVFLPSYPIGPAEIPEPVATAVSWASHEPTVPLSDAQLLDILALAGWPEALWPEALVVIRCESGGKPGSLGDSGRARGLFQVHAEPWFAYAGEDVEAWADPVTNARVALAAYRYDLAKGYAPWTQWTCKPWR